jgi:cobalt-zinc-cadmium efflux system outer membrane protein
MDRRILLATMRLAILCCGLAPASKAQGPPESRMRTAPGSPAESRLGPAPGSGGVSHGSAPGQGGGLIGGRPGPSTPRVPQGATRPGANLPEPLGGAMDPIGRLPAAELPAFGPLEVPEEIDEGPAGGLTLDAAIEQLVRENLDLRAKAIEIPKAEADVLTAGLRANPLLYMDVQQAPYQGYSDRRPGGPTQYDVNITHPFDISGKRRARTAVASRARKVVEAQYQDSVRLAINDVAEAFTDVLAARETVRFTETSYRGLDEALRLVSARERAGEESLLEVESIEVQRASAALALPESEYALRDAKRALATLLNLPPEASESLELRGSLRDSGPPPPHLSDLLGIALESRPDLAAFRLGVNRAEADVTLARANRFEDIFVLFQPYTFQDLSPFDQKSAHSWALGVTVPLPLYNRNQGNILRAKHNVVQTKVELSELERLVVAEVERAYQAYAVSRGSVERFERGAPEPAALTLDRVEVGERPRGILVVARQARDRARGVFERGGDLGAYLAAQRNYTDVVRLYRDTLVRHRRSMLQLNTAVGRRIFP